MAAVWSSSECDALRGAGAVGGGSGGSGGGNGGVGGEGL
jgi:hypothetical protein